MTAIAPVSMNLDLDDVDDASDWAHVGRQLSAASTAIQWALGDWYAHGADLFAPELVDQIVENLDLEVDTLRRYASVCRTFPPHLRRSELSYAAHRTLTARGLSSDDRYAMLSRAATNGWSCARTRSEVDNVLHQLSRPVDPAPAAVAAAPAPVDEAETVHVEPPLIEMVDRTELDSARRALAAAEAEKAAAEEARRAADARAREAEQRAANLEAQPGHLHEITVLRQTVEALERQIPRDVTIAPVPDNVARLVVEFRAPCSDTARAAATRERMVQMVDKLAKALEPKIEDVAGVSRAVVQGFVL